MALQLLGALLSLQIPLFRTQIPLRVHKILTPLWRTSILAGQTNKWVQPQRVGHV